MIVVQIRLWWMIGFGLSLGLCGSMIRDVWIYWNENAMNLKYEDDAHISTIPFPTVIILPLAQKKDIYSKYLRHNREIANLSNIE